LTGKGKGGKRDITTTSDGTTYNKKSSCDAVKKALDSAQKAKAGTKCLNALKGLLKVLRRGGSMMYYLELLNRSMYPDCEEFCNPNRAKSA
jgi:hypothetical protein